MDVDLTLFLPPDKPLEFVSILNTIGCNFSANDAVASIREHGYCRVEYSSFRVDVFAPTTPFYEQAKARRKKLSLGNEQVFVLDAETLVVFKMMFFRRKDLADIEQIMLVQGPVLDRGWIREQLIELCGGKDPRVIEWDKMVDDIQS